MGPILNSDPYPNPCFFMGLISVFYTYSFDVSMLVGEGAKQWAIENKLEEVDDDFHKTGTMTNILKEVFNNKVIGYRVNDQIKPLLQAETK